MRNIAIYVGTVIVAAIGVLLGAALTIPDECAITDACASTQRSIILFAPVSILLLGVAGAAAFTIWCWRDGIEWRRWFGAVWFLLVILLVVMSMAGGVLTG
ncbi:hypothetical protein HT102_06945 [Hoyosella sp. G463]|uniref:Uncharacterized protein n=1 Tax=Lolliginicoccus lacisalsi TaxID=2742202 RepID=A0A927JBI4_9ACTN|nr:hypothetical protein [Lolliginicoccus lacisalsi]MBD8506216.1 hypothetical protein [Lolliginicoccus lacisalsi]